MEDQRPDPTAPPIAPDAIPGYRIVRELGRGGMATVYLAVQESLGREVALKLLTRRLAEDPAAAERFVREARTAARLVHRHIVGIHDVGSHDAGQGKQPYLAMEYLPGDTLATGTMPPRQALEVAREIALALDHAHKEGVVHRDIKPDNILRRADGSAALADFGIARTADGGGGVTQEGVTLGTPHYMSPEQLQGKELDGRSDLYSLGVVLYQLLTGEVPYKGTDGWNVGIQHISAPLPQLPDALSRYQPVLDSLLAKDPDRRPQTGMDAAHLIDVALGQSISNETRVMSPEMSGAFQRASDSGQQRARRAADQQRWPTSRKVLVLGAAVVVAGLLGWTAMRARTDSAATQATSRSTASAPAAVPVSTRSIAVLPLVNMSGNPANDYFSDGLAETMLDMLARVPDLKVIARTSSFAFKGKSMDVREIGKRLDAANLLEGSVQQAGDRVRVSVQLIRASDGAHLWANKYDRGLADVFAIQDEIAGEVVKALQLALPAGGEMHVSDAGTTNVEAYQEYLRGNALLPDRTVPGMRQALVHFERAIALDPQYARALAASHLANLLLIQYATVDPASMARTRKHLLKALEIAPDLGEAHTIYGGDLEQAFKLDEAEAEYARGVELAPGYATGFQWYGEFVMVFRGDAKRARDLLEKAYTLDPLSAVVGDVRAMYKGVDGHLEEALADLDKIIAESPDVARHYNARAALREQKGDMVGTLQDYRDYDRLDPDAIGYQAQRCHTLIDLGAVPEAQACGAGLAKRAPDSMDVKKVQLRLYTVTGNKTALARVADATATPAWMKATAMYFTGRPRDALALAKQAWPEVFASPAKINLPEAGDAIFVASMFAQAGQMEAARPLVKAAVSALGDRPRGAFLHGRGWSDVIGHAAIGEDDKALADLQDGVSSGFYLFLPDLDAQPATARLRTNPRYGAILAPARARAAAEIAKARTLNLL